MFLGTWGNALGLHAEDCVLTEYGKNMKFINKCALGLGNILTVNHSDWSSDPQNPDTGDLQSKLAIEFDWKALPQSIK